MPWRVLVISVSLMVACQRLEPLEPPQGTDFPADYVFGSVATDGTGRGGGSGGTGQTVAPGFSAIVEGATYRGGEQNVVAFNSNPYINLTATLLDSSGQNHTFAFSFVNQAGSYAVVGMQEFVRSFGAAKAGFQYSRAVTGTPGSTSSAAQGTLDVLEYRNQRVIGRFTGSATLEGEPLSISAEFNVPVSDQ